MVMTAEADLYTPRRERVVVQVLEKWTRGVALRADLEAEVTQAVRAAADMSFTSMINDMDWEAAALALLQQGDEQ
jgi:GTP-dependent phosphoenolpyruvate carboxykinase